MVDASIDAIMQDTAANDKLTMILFMSYSGKWDIRQALQWRDGPGFGPYLITAGIPDRTS